MCDGVTPVSDVGLMWNSSNSGRRQDALCAVKVVRLCWVPLRLSLQNVRQANRVLNQNMDKILADVADDKKAEARVLLDQLQDGLQEFQQIIQNKQRGLVAAKQKELLAYVGE